MALPKYFSPFPRLELSLEDKKELCRLTKQLVGGVVDDYERFLWRDQSQLSPARWAVVKEREDVRVYHDRSTSNSNSSSSTAKAPLHVLLTVGTMQGSLDDAMFGVINHTTDAMRIKTAYAKDTMVNGTVLATVQEPTHDKPFRSMTVKWGVKGLPLAVRAVSKNRDLVYVESVGLRTLSNGERVGFQLMHSIDFKNTQPLPSFVRANISSCCIWRQQTPDRTQLYMKAFLDLPDGVLAPLVMRSAADAFIAVWRSMHVAQMKKLAWLLRRRRASVADEPPSGAEKSCAVCASPCGGNRASGSGLSSRHGSKFSCCTICSRVVCANCRVRRELSSIAADGQLVERRVAFCVPCLSVTGRVSAADVARDEIGGGRSAAVGPLSDIVKGCSSVTRFSYSAPTHRQPQQQYTSTTASYARGDTPTNHQRGKRRSMTLGSVAPMAAAHHSPSAYATPTVREASAPAPRMTPTKKSNSWALA